MSLFVISCSSDSDSSSIPNSQILGYELRSKSVFENGVTPTIESLTVGNLQNGKLFSETVQNFIGDVSQGSPVTTQTYFYSGDLLVSQIDNSTDRLRDFYYDATQRIIGAKMTIENSSVNYYRINHVSDNVIYFERTSLPYNDAATVILSRNIIEFDENDNIIKAGRDANLDGIAENENQFFYVDNNLTSITKFDGTIQNFSYSNVIDSFMALNDKSYGKKNLRIIGSEGYVVLGPQAKFQSKNILSQDLLENTYDVLSTNFYKKKTVVKNYGEPQLQNTTTTEFFFN